MRKFGKPIVLRRVVTSDRAMVVLAEHALGLPHRHPVRVTITGLLRRFQEGEPLDDGGPVAGPEDLAEIMEEAA